MCENLVITDYHSINDTLTYVHLQMGLIEIYKITTFGA